MKFEYKFPWIEDLDLKRNVSMAFISFLGSSLYTLLVRQVNDFLKELRGRRLGLLPLIWFFSEVAQSACCRAPQDLGWGGAGGPPGGVARGVACSRGWPPRLSAKLRWLAQPRFAAARFAAGRCSSRGRCGMLVDSPRLRSLRSAPAEPTRPGRGGTPAMLLLRSPASQPRGSKGKTLFLAGEAAVHPRSLGGRLRIASQPASATHITRAPPAQGARESGDHGGKGANRTPRMDARTWRLSWRCLLLLAFLGSTRSEGVESCEEVRKLFQWRLGGAVKGLPYTPRAGTRSWLVDQAV